MYSLVAKVPMVFESSPVATKNDGESKLRLSVVDVARVGHTPQQSARFQGRLGIRAESCRRPVCLKSRRYHANPGMREQYTLKDMRWGS